MRSKQVSPYVAPSNKTIVLAKCLVIGTAFLKASAKLPSNKEVRAKIMAENAALLGTIGEQLAAEAATQEPSSCPECIHG